MAVIFCTFANAHWYSTFISLRRFYNPARIKSQAENSGYFDKVIVYTQRDLKQAKDFWQKHKQFIKTNKKGYGFWLWKPYLALFTLNQMQAGDILCYADAGCSISISPAARKRMAEYLNMLKTSPHGLLSFQLPHLEKHWTKQDTINALALQNSNFLQQGQLIGGVWFIKKSPKNLQLIQNWYRLAENYHLLDDSPSHAVNAKDFKDHRHDQSLFSLLRKKHGSLILPDETYMYDQSVALNLAISTAKFPILATRICQKGLFAFSFKRKLFGFINKILSVKTSLFSK